MLTSIILAKISIGLMSPGASAAPPQIIALSVTSMCRVKGTNVLSVSVKLNAQTANHYGTSLKYKFVKLSDNSSQTLPSPTPASNPVELALGAGSYKLTITDSGGSITSPEYPIVVPANLYISGPGGKKICNKVFREYTGPRPKAG